ncbi:MAG: twin transmembrane helix small protein [Proteobacteria bacterium]|nr:twin transmembrane helix small protein [Pseudomonadota bacterium]
MLIKLFIIFMLLAIIVSLFSGLFFMFRKKESNDDRMVKALTVRIGLSVGLFALLITLFLTGVVKPGGIPVMPIVQQAQ